MKASTWIAVLLAVGVVAMWAGQSSRTVEVVGLGERGINLPKTTGATTGAAGTSGMIFFWSDEPPRYHVATYCAWPDGSLRTHNRWFEQPDWYWVAGVECWKVYAYGHPNFVERP